VLWFFIAYDLLYLLFFLQYLQANSEIYLQSFDWILWFLLIVFFFIHLLNIQIQLVIIAIEFFPRYRTIASCGNTLQQ